MVIGSFDSADILVMPAEPGISSLDWTMSDTVSVSESPWNGSQQAQYFPNDGWLGTITLPQMDCDEAADWDAFLAELQGMRNVFFLGHPSKVAPRGFALGLPLVLGTAAANASTFNTQGWTPNVAKQLRAGDHLQLGNYLHRVVLDVDSDASGNASVKVWPILREPLADGLSVILSEPKGLFRLAENQRTVTTNSTNMNTVTLKVKEARKNAS